MTPDPRFFDLGRALDLSALARLAGARLVDGAPADRRIDHVAILSAADGSGVSFCADRKHLEVLAATRAGACFVSEAHVATLPGGCAALVTAWPQAAYAAAAEHFHRPRRHEGRDGGVHLLAEIEDGVHVAPGAVVGPGARIGRGTFIAPGAVIGPGVAMGRDGYVGAGARVAFALIGDRVKIYAGAVIGEAGFGAAGGARGLVDLPQLGRVILQDGVTIGANSCVDRGAWDDTVIGENTKIDNLVQIAHNVVVGRNCVLAAQTGISGSVTIGDGCQLGGRVGVADHLTIGAGARLAAAAGVMKDVPAGESWGGFPARPVRSWMRQTAWLTRAAQGRSANEGDTRPKPKRRRRRPPKLTFRRSCGAFHTARPSC